MKLARNLLFALIIISLVLFPGRFLFAQVEKVELAVSGMVCNLCAYGVEKNLRRQKGVADLINKQEEQLIIVTAKEGESLDIHKLVKAVRDSELGVRELKVVVSGRFVNWKGDLALKEGIHGQVFLLEGLKSAEKTIGEQVKLVGKVHALEGKTLPHLVVESSSSSEE